jgi:hypothetical protein
MESRENDKAVAVEKGDPPARQGMVRRALGWYWGQRDSASKGEPVKRTLVALALLAIGVAGSEAYGHVRDRFRAPDAYLVRMKQDQDAAFRKLQDSLGALGSSVDGGGRAALAEVKGAVGEMKAMNAGLFAQLALARQENQRLSQVAGRQAGVQGGYDVILSENTGMALDAASVLGVQTIHSNSAQVSVSAGGQDDQTKWLKSGDSIAYQGKDGQSCRVILLSIGSSSSASFKTSCG